MAECNSTIGMAHYFHDNATSSSFLRHVVSPGFKDHALFRAEEELALLLNHALKLFPMTH